MIHRFRSTREARNETIWLTIYADLITNLMLVFLALYGLTVMGGDAMTRALLSMKLSEQVQKTDAKLEFEAVLPVLRETFKSIPNVTLSDESGLARIEFGEKALFESGRADLTSSGVSSLMQLASVLIAVPYSVVVEGYTDNVPLIPGSSFRDNRELSLARAMAVVRLLTDQGALPKDQLAAAAYGEYKPRASNVTADGRRMNRRVDILLVRDIPYKPVVKAETSHVQ
jgi:chemotaxis protein MotB